jgi:SAM-dependent methyltransferase
LIELQRNAPCNRGRFGLNKLLCLQCWRQGPTLESMKDSRRRLRRAFEEVPEAYERARPVYPPQVFDDLVSLAELPEHARVLEIGPGTGQGTLPLARRGYEIVGIELGEGLAARARHKLADFPNAKIINADFESWELGDASFDAIVAFTAFHWIDPETRYRKTAALLKPEGALAVIATNHVLPEGGDRFWRDVQEDYEAVVPDEESTKAGAPGPPEAVEDLSAEITASGLFRNVAVRRYLWDVTYTADEYIAVLDTYSGHRSLEPATRQRLYERIHKRIASRSEPAVAKTYLAILNIARKMGT